MQDQNKNKLHSLSLSGRERLTLSGVSDVSGFDEQTVSVDTSCGKLIIKGSCLHIGKLSLETGEVDIDGKISSLQYLEGTVKKGLVSRLFK